MAATQTTESASEATATLVAFALGAVFVVWSTWVTIIAFTGGSAPLVTFDGPDIGRGLFVLILGVPIAGTVFYWIGMLVTVAVAAVVGGIVDLFARD